MPAETDNRKIRLLQIVRDLDLGGLQQVVYNLCRTIDRSQFEVAVLCLHETGIFAADIEALGIPVYLLEQKADGVDYLAFLKVASLMKRLGIDVVHTHNTQAFFDGTLGALFAGAKTVINTDHARNFPDAVRYMIAEWALSKFAYKVVGCSDHTSQQLIKYEKISPKKVVTIPNGIDGSRFKINIDREAKRTELGIRSQGAILGIAVRISEQKGITFMLNAMRAILRKHPETTLVIAGDGELKSSLEEEARALGIAESVIFCGPRKDIPELLQLFDVYVLPSVWEGLPMIILEAMAAGCPIVASDVGGVSSAVKHDETGLLVPAGDIDNLSAAVIRLLDDTSLRETFAKRATDRFETYFSADSMTAKYTQLYLRQT